MNLVVRYTRTLPDPQSDIAVAHMGGAPSRVPDGATAYARREAPYALLVHGRWADPAKDEACVAWTRELFDAAAPFSTGRVYVNFMSADEGDRVAQAYGPNHARLVELKTRYDPTNLFRTNQNIRPAERSAS